MSKPDKFTPEYFLARDFGWTEQTTDGDGFDLPCDTGWIRHDEFGCVEVFVCVNDGQPETATLFLGPSFVQFPYDIHDPEWLDELLYTIWRINPDGTKGKVK